VAEAGDRGDIGPQGCERLAAPPAFRACGAVRGRVL